MLPYREIPRKSEILRLLAQGRVDVSPLRVVALNTEPARRRSPNGRRPDGELLLRWGKKGYRFAVECKAVSTPKQIADAADTVKRASRPPHSFPMVLAPYLSDPQLRLLEERRVSGIDLCGNALIVVPGEILVSRTGMPNKFRRSGVIKKRLPQEQFHRGESFPAQVSVRLGPRGAGRNSVARRKRDPGHGLEGV